VISTIDNLTIKLAAIYDTFIKNLRAEYVAAITGVNPSMPSTRRKFEARGNELAKESLIQYVDMLSESTDDLVNQAMNSQFDKDQIGIAMTDEAKAAVSEYIKGSIEGATAFFWIEAQKDIKYGVSKLRTLGFDVAVTMAQSGIENAVKGAVVKNIIGGVAYNNKGGKMWKSINRVRLTTRHHLLTSFNEVVIFVASNLGEDEFIISNQIGHRYNGKLLSVSGQNGDAYQDIKGSIFHPNSKSLVYRINKSPLT